jgi:hypothetical protein
VGVAFDAMSMFCNGMTMRGNTMRMTADAMSVIAASANRYIVSITCCEKITLCATDNFVIYSLSSSTRWSFLI